MRRYRTALDAPRPAEGSERQGVALVGAIAVVVMVGVFAAAILAFHLAARRTLDQTQRRRQVEYLARAGIELAVAELLAGAEVNLDKSYHLLKNGEQNSESDEVVVRVVADEQEPDVVRISSEATLRRENRPPFVREAHRRYRLVRDESGKIARCEFVAFEFPAASEPADEGATEPQDETPAVEANEGSG